MNKKHLLFVLVLWSFLQSSCIWANNDIPTGYTFASIIEPNGRFYRLNANATLDNIKSNIDNFSKKIEEKINVYKNQDGKIANILDDNFSILTYANNKLEGITGLTANARNTLAKKIEALNLPVEKVDELINDLTDANFRNAIVDNVELVESWKVLQNRPKLRLKTDALESVSNLLNNPSKTRLGLTDEIIGNIHASRLDDGSFKAIVDDLDALGKKIANKPDVEFDNFNSILGKLNDNNPQNSQAAHWIIQDITENVDDFAGKKWKFEATVTNSDGNASFIDAASNEIPPMRIEYKWLTSSTVGKDDFVREFIKRDLFNATDLNKIEWRIKGQKLTKTKVVEYLNSTEGMKALEDLLANPTSSDKIRQWFFMEELDDAITNQHIQSFADSYFSQIFK